MPASQREFRVFFGLLLVLFGFINGADAAESSSLMHRINIFAVDGHDPRVKQSRSGDGAAFAPIVGIESPKLTLQADPRFVEGKRRSSATGFLVSPCYALTNFHVAFGTTGQGNTEDHQSLFFTTDELKYTKITTQAVVWGDFYSTESEDWILLKLDTCVGNSIGWLEIDLRRSGELYNKEVAMAGYPGDKPASFLLDTSKLSIGRI
jgi:hypothetical protein